MNSYDYQPPGGDRISVYPHLRGGAGIVVDRGGDISTGHVWPDDVPGFAAGVAAVLYGSIGKPPPFIVERLELHGEFTHVKAAPFDVSHAPGQVHIDWGPTATGCCVVSPAGAREFAAVLLARADAAEQPGLAEIETLARVIDGGVAEQYGTDTANMNASRRLASVILAAGYTPPGGES